MKKQQKTNEIKDDKEVLEREMDTEVQEKDTVEEKVESAEGIEQMKAQLDEKSKQCEEYYSMLQRAAAEFDNYKKRTAREKESLYSEAVIDTAAAFLPVVDSLERALHAASNSENDGQSLKEGIELVYKQLKDAMKKLGVEEIKSVGEKFDPQLHNAVMHVEDEQYGENEVIEEFQRGYILKDKVIRHSMVKVAN